MTFKSALERYEDIDLNFQGSREGNLFKVRPSAVRAGSERPGKTNNVFVKSTCSSITSQEGRMQAQESSAWCRCI
jgi:hypothetical protein